MPSVEPLVRASVLSIFPSFLARSNVDAEAVLARCGWTSADIADPNRWISLNAVAELFELAARATGDASFGLNYAAAFPEGGTGLLGSLLMTAPTMGDMLKATVDYFEVHSTGTRLRLEQHADIYSVVVGYAPGFTGPQLHYTDFGFAVVVLRLRLAAGPSWRPYAVEFAHRKPADLAAYQRYFGTRLGFDAVCHRFDVRAEDFGKPMPLQDVQGLADTIRDHADAVLAQARTRESIGDRTAAVLTDLIGGDRPFGLDAVAAALGMQERALQWRLVQAGTGYERLLALTRRRLAVHLLRDTDLSIAHIASRLGYSETSAFTRAAQGWFNEAPSARRKRLRETGPEGDIEAE